MTAQRPESMDRSCAAQQSKSPRKEAIQKGAGAPIIPTLETVRLQEHRGGRWLVTPVDVRHAPVVLVLTVVRSRIGVEQIHVNHGRELYGSEGVIEDPCNAHLRGATWEPVLPAAGGRKDLR